MAKKCIECKYFDNSQKMRQYGKCNLHNYLVKPDEKCRHFTENNVNGEIENEKLAYLEKRIEKLESIVIFLSRVIKEA